MPRRKRSHTIWAQNINDSKRAKASLKVSLEHLTHTQAGTMMTVTVVNRASDQTQTRREPKHYKVTCEEEEDKEGNLYTMPGWSWKRHGEKFEGIIEDIQCDLTRGLHLSPTINAPGLPHHDINMHSDVPVESSTLPDSDTTQSAGPGLDNTSPSRM